MLVLEKVFVNPDFSTSLVQAVLARHLYLGAGTPGGVVPGNLARPPNSQPDEAKVRYNAGPLGCKAKRTGEGARATF
jgi:hypothetical protein